MSITIASGIQVGPGIALGGGSGGGTPGVNNIVGYDEMPPPVTPLGTLEDPTATVNSPTGFTINDDTKQVLLLVD